MIELGHQIKMINFTQKSVQKCKEISCFSSKKNTKSTKHGCYGPKKDCMFYKYEIRGL